MLIPLGSLSEVIKQEMLSLLLIQDIDDIFLRQSCNIDAIFLRQSCNILIQDSGFLDPLILTFYTVTIS